jgi:Glucokinase
VLAVGTGLGCSTLIARMADGSRKLEHRALALEFGHTNISPLAPLLEDYEEDQRFLRYLSNEIWDGKVSWCRFPPALVVSVSDLWVYCYATLSPPQPLQPRFRVRLSVASSFVLTVGRGIRFLQYSAEWEDVCSGRGLLNCYRYCCLDDDGADPLEDAASVAAAAQSGKSETAIRAMRLHYTYLLRFAQQLCIGLQAKGVFLAGDNQVGNLGFFWDAECRAQGGEITRLRSQFEHHQKDVWLKPAEVFAQCQSINLNIIGCLHVAERLRVA